MSKENSLTSLVDRQFGSHARAYVTSAVHAKGEDLDALSAFAKSQKFHTALDMGTGGGHIAFTLAPHVDSVTAYDLSENMLAVVADEAKSRGLSNIITRPGPVEHMPFEDGTFDLAATRYSAHHWHDVPAALEEAHRVLKPGGTLVIIDTAGPAHPALDTFLQGMEILRDPSHVRDYSLVEWGKMLREAGFAPKPATVRKVKLDYAAWIARLSTPKLESDALMAMQQKVPQEARDYFDVQLNGDYTIEVAHFVVQKI